MAKMRVKKRNGRWRVFTLVLYFMPIQVDHFGSWREAYDYAYRYHWAMHQPWPAYVRRFPTPPLPPLRTTTWVNTTQR